AKKQPKPSKFSNALLIESADGEILWLQRPDNGIWGGLWSLPLQFVEKVDGKVNGKPTGKTDAKKPASDDESLTVPSDVHSYEKVYETEFT
ncbi:hypothetical protein R0J93_23405, partial [Pseudoalteromonas sp. SIMBA_148]